tara:strand:- start:557 stop:793 length:237 start_codon:yes stop_codon:yes gene_type:complete
MMKHTKCTQCPEDNEDTLWIDITGGTLYTGADLSNPDTLGTLTVTVKVETRYKDIQEFKAVDELGLEHLNKLIESRKK